MAMRRQKAGRRGPCQSRATDNLRTKIMMSRGFDSSRIVSLRGGILMSTGNFLEMLSQLSLVGIILVGRLGVCLNPGRVLWHAVSHEARTPTLRHKMYVLAGPALGKYYSIAHQRKAAPGGGGILKGGGASKPGPPNPWTKYYTWNLCDPKWL